MCINLKKNIMDKKITNVGIYKETYLELKEYCKSNGLKISFITSSVIKNYLEDIKK